MQVLTAARVPVGPIMTVEDMAAEPQYLERGMFQPAAPPDGAMCAPWI